jgi:hypothetical protein
MLQRGPARESKNNKITIYSFMLYFNYPSCSMITNLFSHIGVSRILKPPDYDTDRFTYHYTLPYVDEKFFTFLLWVVRSRTPRSSNPLANPSKFEPPGYATWLITYSQRAPSSKDFSTHPKNSLWPYIWDYI